MNPYLVGGLSGIVEVTFSHPIDWYKIQLQNNQTNIVKRITPRVVYQGYLPKVTSIIPMRMLFWGVQGSINRITEPTPLNHILAGTVAGCVQTLVDGPVEAIKIQMMSGKKFHTGALKYGFYPSMARNMGFAAVVNATIQSGKTDEPVSNFMVGALGAVLGCYVTQPIDYVKTHMQTHGKTSGGFDIFMDCWKDRPTMLFRGVVARTMVAMVGMGIGSVMMNKFT